MTPAPPLRVAIPVPARGRWTSRHLLGTVLALWAGVAALLTAAILAIVWDLRP